MKITGILCSITRSLFSVFLVCLALDALNVPAWRAVDVSYSIETVDIVKQPPEFKCPDEHELPNPDFWAGRGYATVWIDTRGNGVPDGVADQFSDQEAIDYYGAIEWVAEQPWSNGKVATTGTSCERASRMQPENPQGLTDEDRWVRWEPQALGTENNGPFFDDCTGDPSKITVPVEVGINSMGMVSKRGYRLSSIFRVGSPCSRGAITHDKAENRVVENAIDVGGTELLICCYRLFVRQPRHVKGAAPT